MIRMLGVLGTIALFACADDDGMINPDAGTDAPADTSEPDTGTDATTDTGLDAGDDAADDAASDVSADAPVDAPDDATDATVDVGVDASMPCGAGPACAPDEMCWGGGCNCIREIDGDSYLRTDGRVVYASAGMPLAETAPGTPLTNVIEIMDGWRHTCALRDDGTVWCWAKNGSAGVNGEIGDGSTATGRTPMLATQVLTAAATPLTGIAHLSDRTSSRCYIEYTTCAIRGADGAVFCWGGDNAGGGTGSLFTKGSVGNRPFATQLDAADGVPLTGIAKVSVGLRHACAIDTDGGVLCWGMNVGGPLGQGDQVERRYPTVVPLPAGALADEIGVGGDISCARSGDTVFCWGHNNQGGIGYTDDIAGDSDGCINFCRLTPAQVIDDTGAALSGVRHLEVNYLGACAIMTDDTLRCWGDGVGPVATEPSFRGAPLTGVADLTSCSSNSITTAINHMGVDATYYRSTFEATPVCP